MGNFNVASGTSRAPALDWLLEPEKAWVDHQEFLSYDDTATTGDWIKTQQVGSGTAAKISTLGAGGIVRLSAGGTTDTHGIQIQRSSEEVLALSGKPIYYKTRLKISDIDETALFIGLCEIDTSILASAAVSTTLQIGFYADTTSIAATPGYLKFIVKNAAGSNTATSTILMVADTWMDLSFYLDFDGNFVQIFKDDVLIERLTLTRANIPTTIGTGEVSPSFAMTNDGTAGGTTTLDIDYVRVAQPR